jgi:hypothetical protein
VLEPSTFWIWTDISQHEFIKNCAHMESSYPYIYIYRHTHTHTHTAHEDPKIQAGMTPLS